MLGAIAGDIIGSIYEDGLYLKSSNFQLFQKECRFTDDTVMTVAVADSLMQGAEKDDSLYVKNLQAYGRKYPNAGYGGMFHQWIFDDEPKPYNSFGNGSAMRVSPVSFYFNDLNTVLQEAEKSAAVTHNHPEGIKGAQAVAAAVFLARTGHSKDQVKAYVEETFGYNLDRKLEDLRPAYRFDVTCQGSVPESIRCFLESEDVESAIRNAVFLGGDTDTMACIAGGIAEAHYGGVPGWMAVEVKKRLDDDLIQKVEAFHRIAQP